ncbi:zinc transport system substrate-binding protein [Rhodovulum sp. ES.010]|uniref:zinc ABC transporter substrate-binding protein n=1 Tax=Rhodovulum sp. ES.010 TaxID=1882821 RepID=UPI000929809D|nr:zinc ABC transporter substrate-binding protein [Rhodovulum sp. ES.010]SIO51189.1 zinc transport system substrate-binding protein [Rhodovulum sp. ES.010]
MSRNLFPLALTATMLAGTAMAEVPRVAADIAPLHALVARVMQGVGAPDLIVQPGASPHEYSLRPSEAEALQDADIVIWMGEDLAPWMQSAIETLTADASVVTLLEAQETALLEFRENALFEKHAHGDDDHAAEDGAHDHEHDDHAGAEDHAHDTGEHAEAEAHDHDHGAHDPHAWLSPRNAAAWLNLIAGELSAADPENAGTYFANAAEARAEIDTLVSEIGDILDSARGGRFVVFHDAYQYFETAFDIPASGAISLSDARDPSPARIAEIQGRVAEEGIDCVLAEPQFDPGIVATVLEGTEANTAVIDPLGSDLEPGPDLYPQMMRNLASSLAGCL